MMSCMISLCLRVRLSRCPTCNAVGGVSVVVVVGVEDPVAFMGVQVVIFCLRLKL